MKIYEELSSLQDEIFINKGNILYIENKYFQRSFQENEEAAIAIKNIDFVDYKNEIKKCCEKIISFVDIDSVQGIYFECDIDNDWFTNCFLCQEYNKSEIDDEDWACDWLESYYIANFSELTSLYKKFANDIDKYVSMYLIVRTVCAFIEVTDYHLNKIKPAICVAFHDQSYITRLKEISM